VKFTIPPGKVARLLLLIVSGLTCANLVLQGARAAFGPEQLHRWRLLGLTYQFNLGGAQNIPDWYQSSTLLACACLCALIAHAAWQRGEQRVRHWRGLSFIFALLSLIEATEIQEIALKLPQALFEASKPLFFLGAMLAAGFVLLLVFAGARLLAALPRAACLQFLMAGTVYLSGVAGGEMVGEWYLNLYGQRDFLAALITTGEELLEMLGVVAFIYALLAYLNTRASDAQGQSTVAERVTAEPQQDYVLLSAQPVGLAGRAT
jgi:hypothetical protein